MREISDIDRRDVNDASNLSELHRLERFSEKANIIREKNKQERAKLRLTLDGTLEVNQAGGLRRVGARPSTSSEEDRVGLELLQLL